MTPHKHAEVIKAWADGAEIEFYDPFRGQFMKQNCTPSWDESVLYRIKPEPKPDAVQFHRIEVDETGYVVAGSQSKFHNLKLTFDGETGKLKAAEVLE